METESETVTKPDRSPDAVIKPGHAIWWGEMIFMHVYGGVYKIVTDQNDGSLYYEIAIAKRRDLPDGTKEAYDKWWYETFESKFLGDDNE
jgi:hypothetical protein